MVIGYARVSTEEQSLVALQLGALRPDRCSDMLFLTGGAALLLTFSVTIHHADAGGWLPIAADLVHFGAATAWAGRCCASSSCPSGRRRAARS